MADVSPTVPTRPRRRFWRWALGAMALMVLIPALVAVRVFSLASEARALRDAFADTAQQQPSLRVKASMGNWLLGAVGALTRHVPEVPPEALVALDAVHDVSVGVYAVEGPLAPLAAKAWLRACDQRMQPRGWARLVTVADGDQRVVIYARPTRSGRVPLCLGVADGREWVFLSVELEADGVASLAKTLAGRAPALRLAARSDGR